MQQRARPGRSSGSSGDRRRREPSNVEARSGKESVVQLAHLSRCRARQRDERRNTLPRGQWLRSWLRRSRQVERASGRRLFRVAIRKHVPSRPEMRAAARTSAPAPCLPTRPSMRCVFDAAASGPTVQKVDELVEVPGDVTGERSPAEPETHLVRRRLLSPPTAEHQPSLVPGQDGRRRASSRRGSESGADAREQCLRQRRRSRRNHAGCISASTGGQALWRRRGGRSRPRVTSNSPIVWSASSGCRKGASGFTWYRLRRPSRVRVT